MTFILAVPIDSVFSVCELCGSNAFSMTNTQKSCINIFRLLEQAEYLETNAILEEEVARCLKEVCRYGTNATLDKILNTF